MSSRQTQALWRTAQALARTSRRRKSARPGAAGLPPLLLFTDPERTRDPLRAAERLPRGAGVVFRHFGRPDARRVAAGLAEVARRRGLILLVGDDLALALEIGAHGVHLPERRLDADVVRAARRHGLLVTGAAHSAAALRRARALKLDAAVLSPVFPSRSASAGAPLGPHRAGVLARGAGLPVYALGGVQGQSARRLLGTGVRGLAAVDALDG